MNADADTPGALLGPAPGARPRGWRRWVLPVAVAGLLVAVAGTVAVATIAIVTDARSPAASRTISGVRMPDDAHYRDIAGQLLARRHAERLQGLTIVGAGGQVTVIRYAPGKPSFLSAYLNPNALAVIARAIGARSFLPIVVQELRLEVPRGTGRQRWRLRGTQGDRPWRATINPNGTRLRLLPSAPAG